MCVPQFKTFGLPQGRRELESAGSVFFQTKISEYSIIPKHIRPVAYLCLGYVSEFADKPDLERKGWLSRMELNDVIYYEQWDRHRLDSWAQFCSDD